MSDEKTNINYLFWIKKTFWLCLSIVLMSFAHSIFTYTRMIGMSPLTAATESLSLLLGQTANIDGYSITNYIITTILIIAAVIVSEPQHRLKTATCAFTGFGLAIVINIFVVYVIHFLPGMAYNPVDGQGIATNIYWALLWYCVAYVVLVNSIGMWINVGFGLRPYDALLVNLEIRTDKTYLFWRNLWSFIFVMLAIISGIITTSLQNKWNVINFIENSAVGPMTIVTMFLTGKLTKITRKWYSHIV